MSVARLRGKGRGLTLWPATVTGLAAASPAPSLCCGDSGGGAPGTGHQSQALRAGCRWQAHPGIEPGWSWQWLRGYWLAPVNITGCCMSVWPVVRKLTLCPHRCGCRLAPFGCTQPPLCLAPLRPCTRHQLRSCRAKTKACVGHGFAIATKDHGQALRAVMEVGPARPPIRPQGAPQPHATTERTPSTDPPA
jgi:hypothetical protein